MYLNLCPPTIGIANQTLPQLCALAREHGFGGVDLPGEALESVDAAREAAHMLADAGLRPGLFWLPCDVSSADDAAFLRGMAALRTMLPCVQAAGGTRTYNHIWPGSDLRPYAENFHWHVARLRPLTELLGEYGVTLGLEFIGPQTLRDRFRHPFVHTLAEVLELADAVGPSVGVVLDFFHWYASGGTLDALRRRLPAGRIVNVHANDAVAGRPREAQRDDERDLPLATGVIDAAGLMRWLREIGYDGPIIAEPFTPQLNRLRALPADSVAREVGACLTRLLQQD
jgi:sugar phosphate isomerase/epimerase